MHGKIVAQAFYWVRHGGDLQAVTKPLAGPRNNSYPYRPQVKPMYENYFVLHIDENNRCKIRHLSIAKHTAGNRAHAGRTMKSGNI